MSKSRTTKNDDHDDMDPLLPQSGSSIETRRPLELEIEDIEQVSTMKENKQSYFSQLSPASTTTTRTPIATPTSPSKLYKKSHVIVYMLIFFFMMIGHEVALEAASHNFHQLDSLASAVTLFQFGFCFLLPLITSTSEVMRTFPKTWKATIPYVQLSILVFGATGLATQSLKYVSYPTKVVFKSAKLIPTMILSTFVTSTHSSGHSKYGFLDYLGALFLCLGAAGYSYNSSRGSEEERHTSIYGISLLVISIICDSLLPNLQQNLMATHNENHFLLLPSTMKKESNDNDGGIIVPGLSAQAVMVNTNAVGFGSILIYMLLSGSLVDAISTSITHPMLLFYLTCVGVGLSLAVLAYTKLIHASGSVVAVAVSTLRKVATVLLSYMLFPKPILQIHVFSGMLVLVGVLIGTFCRKK